MTRSERKAIAPRSAILLVGGLGAGFVGGLFGVGGGILIVPVLALGLRFAQRNAHATSLATVVLTTIAGVLGYAVAGEVDWWRAVALVPASLLGARLGTRLLHRLSNHALRIAFACFMLAASVRMLLPGGVSAAAPDLDLRTIVSMAVLGLLGGIASSLLGVGGGIIYVPVMSLLLHVPQTVAKGTSLAAIIPSAVLGSTANLRAGLVDVRTVVLLSVPGVIGSSIGAQVSLVLDPLVSKRLFAVFLIVVGIRLLVQREKADAAVVEPIGEE